MVNDGEWEKKKYDFLDWLEKNPDASSREAEDNGHEGVLRKCYGYKINYAKHELKIPVGRNWRIFFQDLKLGRVRGKTRIVAKHYKLDLDTLNTYFEEHAYFRTQLRALDTK